MIKIFEENKWISWMATTLIAVGIFIISNNPSYGVGGYDFGLLPIFYHFFAFFFLSFFFTVSFVRGFDFGFAYLIITLTFLYACLDELHQYFIFGRTCSWFDVLVDSIGIILGFLLYYFYKKIQR